MVSHSLLTLVPAQCRSNNTEESYQAYFTHARAKVPLYCDGCPTCPSLVQVLERLRQCQNWTFPSDITADTTAVNKAVKFPADQFATFVWHCCCFSTKQQPGQPIIYVHLEINAMSHRSVAVSGSAFLSVILRRLSRCLEQSYEVNLMVTGILSNIVQVCFSIGHLLSD